MSLEKKEDELHRRIGIFDGISLVAGSMLGIGIFLAPIQMAKDINHPISFILLWLFTGMIALSGASAYAELGVLLPHSGGDYVFHRTALGKSASFAYGWGLLAAGFAGSIAAMTVPLCTFQLSLLTGFDSSQLLYQNQWFELSYAQFFALLLLWLMTFMHYEGLRLASLFQSLTTYIPLFFLLAFAGYAYVSDHTHWHVLAIPAEVTHTMQSTSISALSSGFLDAYFAYSGWNAIIYVAGEVKNPEKTLPYSLVGGTMIVTLLYLLLCGTAIYVLGYHGLQSLHLRQQDMGSAIAFVLGGNGAQYFMVVLISIALLASINATILGGARVAFALAMDGAFWEGAKQLHPQKKTPIKALFAQAVISSLVIVFIPWDYIFSTVSLVMVIGAALSVLSMYILRKKAPSPRQYQALGYPYFPLLFVSSAIFVLATKLYAFYQGEKGSAYPISALLFVFLIFILHSIGEKLKANPSAV